MDVADIVESTSGNSNKMGGALITIILAGFLWVGKTTFEHVGQIAGIRHELTSAHQDDKLLRSQYDEIVSMLNERTKSRFTREDADKLAGQIREVEGIHNALKDSFLRDYTSLKIELANLESQLSPSSPPLDLLSRHANPIAAAAQIQQLEQEIAGLHTELVQLRRHVGLTRNDFVTPVETPRALMAQPNPDRLPVTRR